MTHKIELRPLESLNPNPMNPKAHDEALLHKSLSAFGYVEPIVIDGRTDMMISGHGRHEVLRQLHQSGAEPPEGVTVKSGKWMVPVVTGWSSKDDTEVNAVLVALNRTTERGGWNDENLLAILENLSEHDSLDLAGYAETDVVMLKKIVEAHDVFGADLDSVIDEFMEEHQLDDEGVILQYSSAVKVYFQTEGARAEFYRIIGYDNDPTAKQLRYPKSFKKEAAEEWTG